MNAIKPKNLSRRDLLKLGAVGTLGAVGAKLLLPSSASVAPQTVDEMTELTLTERMWQDVIAQLRGFVPGVGTAGHGEKGPAGKRAQDARDDAERPPW